MYRLSDLLREAKAAGVSLYDALRKAPERMRMANDAFSRIEGQRVGGVNLSDFMPSRQRVMDEMKQRAQQAWQSVR